MLAAVLLHGVWDSAAALAGGTILAFVIMIGTTIAAVMPLFVALRLGGSRERMLLQAVLAPELTNGTITHPGGCGHLRSGDQVARIVVAHDPTMLCEGSPMTVRQSPFVQDAATGRRSTRWWLAILVFVVIFGINIGLLAAVSLAWRVPAGSPQAQLQEAIGDLLTILVVFAWVTLYERRRIATLGFHRPGRGLLALLLGVVVGLAMISIPILLLWATGVYQEATPPAGSTSGWSALPLVLVLALTVILQGSNEEILTRGFLFQSLGLQLPGWLAILIPTLLFTIVHGVATTPIPFTTIFFYGLFAVFVALQRNSLWLICGIHASWNWGLGNVFGISVSGLDPHTAAVVYLQAAAGQPDWLTGGNFGTEGSLVASLMIVVATALVFAAYRRRESAQPSDRTGQESARGAK